MLDIDRVPLKPMRGRAPKEFYIGRGCQLLTAKYEESFFSWGDKRAARKGLGTGLEVSIAESQLHTYETEQPIRFYVPVKAGYKYWVTATFTGDEFLPRFVEIAPNGDSVGKFLPDQPCH